MEKIKHLVAFLLLISSLLAVNIFIAAGPIVNWSSGVILLCIFMIVLDFTGVSIQ